MNKKIFEIGLSVTLSLIFFGCQNGRIEGGPVQSEALASSSPTLALGPGNPIIFHVSPSADPTTNGFHVIGIRGDGFGTSPYVSLNCSVGSCQYVISQLCASSASTNCILKKANDFISVALPNDAVLGEEPFYVSIETSTKTSSRFVVNSPNIQQLEFDQLYPGELFRIFGANLKLKNISPLVEFVPIVGGGSVTAQVVLSSSDSTILTVETPTQIKAGEKYQIRVINAPSSGLSGQVVSKDEIVARSALPADRNYGLNIPWQVDLPSYKNLVNAKSPPDQFYKSFPKFCTTTPSTLSGTQNIIGKINCVNFCPANLQNGSCVSGAKGDGKSDDQPILQALLLYVATQKNSDGTSGGVLYLPSGNYVLESNNSLQGGCYSQLTFKACSGPEGQPQVINNSVLSIPSNVILEGEVTSIPTLYYGFGPAPITPSSTGQYNQYHAMGLVFSSNTSLTASHQSFNSGVENLKLINLNQTAGYVPASKINLSNLSANTSGVGPDKCTTAASETNSWGVVSLFINTLNFGSGVKPVINTVSQVFVSNVTFDETRSSSVVNLIGNGLGATYGNVSHVLFQNSTILRGNCYHSWAPLQTYGQYFYIRNNTIHNYYSRNSELGGDHFIIEGNTFERHRDRVSSIDGANNGGPEFGGTNMVFLKNQSSVVGTPPPGDLLMYGVNYSGNPQRLGSVLANHDGYGENFNTQTCTAPNQDVGTVASGTGTTTLVGASFKGSRWWIADPEDDWTKIAEGTPEDFALLRLWEPSAVGGLMSRYVAIIDGPGAGQLRKIVRYQSSDTLIIDHPWDETPIAGKSIYSVVAGGVHDTIIKENTLSNSPIGFVIYCGGTNVQLIANNLKDDGKVWLRSFQEIWSYPATPTGTPQFVGRYNLLWDSMVSENIITDSESPAFGASGWHPYFPASIQAVANVYYNPNFPSPKYYIGGAMETGIEMRSNVISLLPNMIIDNPGGGGGNRGFVAATVWTVTPNLFPHQTTELINGTIFDSNRVSYLNASPDALNQEFSYQCDITLPSGASSLGPISTSGPQCVAPKGDKASINVVLDKSEDDFAYTTYGSRNSTIWNPLISSTVNSSCLLNAPSGINPASSSYSSSKLTAKMPLLPPLGWTSDPAVAAYYQCTSSGQY